MSSKGTQGLTCFDERLKATLGCNRVRLEEYYPPKVMSTCDELSWYEPIISDVYYGVCFLIALKAGYEPSLILGSKKLPSLPNVFSRVQCATVFGCLSVEFHLLWR